MKTKNAQKEQRQQPMSDTEKKENTKVTYLQSLSCGAIIVLAVWVVAGLGYSLLYLYELSSKAGPIYSWSFGSILVTIALSGFIYWSNNSGN